jgi:hypothetical protein
MLLIINSDTEEYYPLEFFLKQDARNPLTGIIKIKYCVAYRTKVILIVIDDDGNVVKKLISKEQGEGIYETEFIPDGLPGGTYYLQLIAGDYSSTKKIELAK